MSKQYHFVVQFDADSNEFSIDIDTLNNRFTDGPIFYAGEQGWGWSNEPEEDYLAKEDILAGWLQHINNEIKED